MDAVPTPKPPTIPETSIPVSEGIAVMTRQLKGLIHHGIVRAVDGDKILLEVFHNEWRDLAVAPVEGQTAHEFYVPIEDIAGLSNQKPTSSYKMKAA